jgi:tetratricopeptide (TPR) repeat protein
VHRARRSVAVENGPPGNCQSKTIAGAYFAKSAQLSRSRRFDEALRTADAGLAINPNFAPLYGLRGSANASLGQFEQAKSDAQLAMRLSPRDPLIGVFHVHSADAELGLGHFDAAIGEYHKAVDSGFRPFFVYCDLAAAYALAGKMDEAKRLGRSAPPQPQAHGQMDD